MKINVKDKNQIKKQIINLLGNKKWSSTCNRIKYWVDLCAELNKSDSVEVCLYTTSDYNYIDRNHTARPEHNAENWDIIKNVGTKSFGPNNYLYIYCFVK